ncbi:unnamed protein product [Polarella glacialis]|uniref:Uncharacterized protein n=1 Tax=Polarella glacialis TaxID=89957 RepID=A0A813HA02_POLGL|nr:unnamed protein product [Polarella glacialis]CAE8653062.1 unnamed protein product [Polarella glacialis]CAE8709578.1 unnamed protein product [Polarella glacialis]
MKQPPPCVLIVLQAVLHLLAGRESSIKLKPSRSRQCVSWQSCVTMVKSRSFVASQLKVQQAVDDGKSPKENVKAAKALLDSIEDDSENDKVTMTARGSTSARRSRWMFAVIAYHTAVSEISARFSGIFCNRPFPQGLTQYTLTMKTVGP